MTEKKSNLRDFVKEQYMWKAHVDAEDESLKVWEQNWGWILDEYKCMKKKLDKKAEKSTFLAAVKKEVAEDHRKLEKVPESTNHLYGWVAKEDDFKLDRYGPDYFKPLPMPSLYYLMKSFPR